MKAPFAVVDLPKKGHLNEAFSFGFEYTLVNNEGVGYHSPANCKDYFQDLWWSERRKKPASVYGFSWKPGTVDPDQAWYLMAITHSKLDIGGRADKLAAFMNFFERGRGYPLSKVWEATDQKGRPALVVRFANEWTRQPLLISAFTQALRLGVSYEAGDPIAHIGSMNGKGNPFCGADNPRIATLVPRFTQLAEGHKWTQGWDMEAISAHNEEGFINAKCLKA